ncbi:MAG: DUF2493 domain-containing protein [Clostridia bacterium]|nr:DUF2493 domain-containing protein [Clostridia bacterium]MBQ9919334.1 DUF2493 domain-containing protein [Clostridia bacterium]
MKIRIVIGGCRDFNDYNFFCKHVNRYLERIKKNNEIILLSGHCKGVDVMAEKYAKEQGFGLEIHPADWQKFGKSAGPKRNREMVITVDCVIAFWDGKSRGTKSLIEYAKQYEKPIRIKRIDI